MGYLKVKEMLFVIVIFLFGFSLGAMCVGYHMNRIICAKQERVEMFRKMFHLMCRWSLHRDWKKPVLEYLSNSNYKNIAVYGIGKISKVLQNELMKTDIKISYGIDDHEILSDDIKIYFLSDDLPPVDAVIVTSIYCYEQIERILSNKLKCPIVSLEHIVYAAE